MGVLFVFVRGCGVSLEPSGSAFAGELHAANVTAFNPYYKHVELLQNKQKSAATFQLNLLITLMTH